jgi:phosphoribosylformimino-5-aminoimidazole carboxamide ribotide isomerase
MHTFRVIPVLDLKGGAVVRGVGGRRENYRPIVSRLTSDADPTSVAQAFRDRLGLNELYLADLDAIAGAPPALAVYRALREQACRLWIDAGTRRAEDAEPLVAAGVERIVVGLETVQGPEVLKSLARTYGNTRVLFSLDLTQGQPLGEVGAWKCADADSLAAEAAAAGAGALIVLDLARVGLGGGTGTERLCQRLADTHPHIEIVAGGGVSSRADLQRLRACGVRAALVASALHDGRIGPDDLARL